MQHLSTMSYRRSKRSTASNTQEHATVGTPSGKKSTQGTASVGRSEVVF